MECDEIPPWAPLPGKFQCFPTNGQGLKCKSEIRFRISFPPKVNFTGGLQTSRPYHTNSESLMGAKLETRYLAYMRSTSRQTLLMARMWPDGSRGRRVGHTAIKKRRIHFTPDKLFRLPIIIPITLHQKLNIMRYFLWTLR